MGSEQGFLIDHRGSGITREARGGLLKDPRSGRLVEDVFGNPQMLTSLPNSLGTDLLPVPNGSISSETQGEIEVLRGWYRQMQNPRAIRKRGILSQVRQRRAERKERKRVERKNRLHNDEIVGATIASQAEQTVFQASIPTWQMERYVPQYLNGTYTPSFSLRNEQGKSVLVSSLPEASQAADHLAEAAATAYMKQSKQIRFMLLGSVGMAVAGVIVSLLPGGLPIALGMEAVAVPGVYATLRRKIQATRHELNYRVAERIGHLADHAVNAFSLGREQSQAREEPQDSVRLQRSRS